jgi:hypothetical protein
MTHRCPKCQGMTYQETTIGLPQNHCANCGLFQEVGGATESLKKQILGDLYEHTRAAD